MNKSDAIKLKTAQDCSRPFKTAQDCLGLPSRPFKTAQDCSGLPSSVLKIESADPPQVKHNAKQSKMNTTDSLLNPLFQEAVTWLKKHSEKIHKPEDSASNSASTKFVMVIPDHDYDKLLKYLQRTKIWRITFDEDTEPTLFKMVKDTLMGFDSRFPEGRKVMRTSEVNSQEIKPMSVRGLIDTIVITFNPGGYCDKNIFLSRMFYKMLPDSGNVSTQLIALTAFFIFAQRNGASLEPCGDTALVFGLPNEMTETDGHLLRFLFGVATGKEINIDTLA